MNAQDCIALSARTNFGAYIDLLRNLTKNDFSLVKDCRKDVCEALWGSGNPDISGIGMVIGYVLESLICVCLIAISLWLERSAEDHPSVMRLLVANAARTFFDNALFFTFAIQAASIVTLSRVDFGINAHGMGGLTMEIAWLVSSLTLLPLLPMILHPTMFIERMRVHETRRQSSSDTAVPTNGVEKESGSSADGHSEAISETRRGQRFLLFVVCWAMGFCPFFSRMGGTFGKSRIGNAPDTSITPTEWSIIEGVCFEGTGSLSSHERNLITAFGILSYLLLSVAIISKIMFSALDDGDGRRVWLVKYRNLFGGASVDSYARLATEIVLAIALIIQFWAFFRLRQLQSDMAQAAGGSFPDGQWTFGQIVATVVFIPVAVEITFVWKRRSLYFAKG